MVGEGEGTSACGVTGWIANTRPERDAAKEVFTTSIVAATSTPTPHPTRAVRFCTSRSFEVSRRIGRAAVRSGNDDVFAATSPARRPAPMADRRCPQASCSLDTRSRVRCSCGCANGRSQLACRHRVRRAARRCVAARGDRGLRRRALSPAPDTSCPIRRRASRAHEGQATNTRRACRSAAQRVEASYYGGEFRGASRTGPPAVGVFSRWTRTRTHAAAVRIAPRPSIKRPPLSTTWYKSIFARPML